MWMALGGGVVLNRRSFQMAGCVTVPFRPGKPPQAAFGLSSG
jgi:hypothetical protein